MQIIDKFSGKKNNTKFSNGQNYQNLQNISMDYKNLEFLGDNL